MVSLEDSKIVQNPNAVQVRGCDHCNTKMIALYDTQYVNTNTPNKNIPIKCIQCKNVL